MAGTGSDLLDRASIEGYTSAIHVSAAQVQPYGTPWRASRPETHFSLDATEGCFRLAVRRAVRAFEDVAFLNPVVMRDREKSAHYTLGSGSASRA